MSARQRSCYADGMSRSLYEQDFVRWSEEQARIIRDAGQAGTNLPIDWENVAEEIDSLGRSQRSDIRSRIRTIIAHLMKLEASPAARPRQGWFETVLTQRRDIEGVLEDSPSLRAEVPGLIEWALPRARDDTRRSLAVRAEQPEVDLERIRYTEEQVLGDWLPETPEPVSRATAPRRPARNR